MFLKNQVDALFVSVETVCQNCGETPQDLIISTTFHDTLWYQPSDHIKERERDSPRQPSFDRTLVFSFFLSNTLLMVDYSTFHISRNKFDMRIFQWWSLLGCLVITDYPVSTQRVKPPYTV